MCSSEGDRMCCGSVVTVYVQDSRLTVAAQYYIIDRPCTHTCAAMQHEVDWILPGNTSRNVVDIAMRIGGGSG